MKINQIKAGITLNYFVIGLNSLVGLFYTPYMLRMMGQNEYGLYSLVASVISYLTILDLGFGNAIIRYTAKLRAQNKFRAQYELFGMFIVLYTIIGIIAFLIGLSLYFNVDNLFGKTMSIEDLDKARIMMLLLIFNLAFTFPMSIFGSIIQAYENFVFQKVLNICRIILSTTVMIVLLSLGYKAITMTIVVTIFNVATLISNFIYCKFVLKIQIIFGVFNKSLLKEISIYSFWIFLMIIVNKLYLSTGQFVLGAIVGTAAVAVFSIALQLRLLYETFSTAMSTIFLPKVTGMVARNDDRSEISNLFIRTGRIQYIILSFILTGFIIFGKSFIILWAGNDYCTAYTICLILFIPSTIPLTQNLGIVILQARNNMKFRSLSYLVISISSVFLQIVLAKHFGALGCAIAIACATVLGQILIMNIYYYYRQGLDMVGYWKNIAKMSVMPIILSFVYLLIIYYWSINLNNWTTLIIWIFIFSIIYILLAVLFQINNSERRLFFHPISKLLQKLSI